MILSCLHFDPLHSTSFHNYFFFFVSKQAENHQSYYYINWLAQSGYDYAGIIIIELNHVVISPASFKI